MAADESGSAEQYDRLRVHMAYMDASLLQGISSFVQTRKVAVLYPALYAATPLAPMKSADPRLILLTGCEPPGHIQVWWIPV
jgi:hypothetical protein